ncbi:mechanosensitive ion channel family protein [Brevundimonas variabilis]|uniref:Small-conductance mechanosensitive channel n=1 Tax=Brevundimonas variabilis TaxID=74312 RepID=A0A7W9CH98_9CAUL|nr:mechanosensitive ion channel family protein [Brevundimonas variabilis]MBB5745368.1 small conductance mechanosensitive channel [Brevundimonas variabilis]
MSTPIAPVLAAVTAGEKAAAFDVAMLARLTDLAGDFAINTAIALIILVATVFAAKWAARATRRGLSRVRGFRHDPTVLSFAIQVVRVVVYIIGFIAVLQRLGVQTTSILAVLGAASLAVGLALQGTLSNVAAGVMLLVLRPYRVGDLVDINNNVGKVTRLDLFFTQMSDANNVKIVIPNAKVFSDTMLNLSGQQTRRMELKMSVGYSSDLTEARHALITAASAHEKVLQDPAPWAGVTNLLDSAVEVTLQAWTKSEDYWQTKADVFQAAKEALDAANIEIPFPHQVAVPYGTEDMMPVVTRRASQTSPSSNPSPGDAHTESSEG